jgi:hypothetical protein
MNAKPAQSGINLKGIKLDHEHLTANAISSIPLHFIQAWSNMGLTPHQCHDPVVPGRGKPYFAGPMAFHAGKCGLKILLPDK